MFDDDPNQRNGGNRGQKKPPGGFKVPTSTWILWIAILGGLVALMMLKSRMTTQGDTLSQSEFLQKFSSNQIAHATINFNSQSSPLTPIVGTYYKTGKDGKPGEASFSAPNAMLTQKMLDELLVSDKIEAGAPNAMLWSIGYQLLFFVCIGLLFWFFFIRQIKIAGKGALSFGRSKARLLAKDRNKTTFKDVAGIDEA
ncbi:MAG: ATP-dependent metallopeptidase FtsH/Yme1/Tma family protein, partial [Verrucomicrobiota bacterium]